MQAPLDSVRSADWFVYHDWCIDMLAKGQHPPRPPVVIRHIAEALQLYEQRGEEPLLWLRSGSGWAGWSMRPDTLRNETAWAFATRPLSERQGAEPEYATNPQRRPWLKKNHPDCCWDFFGCLLYLAASGKRA
jgi:hypothetical protein